MKISRVLLVAYIFPPFPGIGGRRWAKHAKYLAKKGYEVHVICAHNPFEEISLWQKDIAGDKKIIVHALPVRYPLVFLKGRLSFPEKLSYRFWKYWLSFRYHGTIYDRAIAWEKQLEKTINTLVNSINIRCVIASGAPFHLLYHTVQICKRLDLPFIADFRDPWVNGFAFGIKNLKTERMQVEKEMESTVVKNADLIISPSQKILDYLVQTYREPVAKFHVLPHAFDADDFPAQIPAKANDGKFRIIFVGAVYEGLEIFLRTFFSHVKKKNEAGDPIYSQLQFDFYTKDKLRLQSIVGYKWEGITFHDPVAPPEIFGQMAKCDAVLVAFSEFYKDFISTKFYEIFRLRLPIIYIGPDGEVSRFLLSHDMGEWLSPENLETEIDATLKRLATKKYGYTFDVDAFSMGTVTDQLVSMLEKVTK